LPDRILIKDFEPNQLVEGIFAIQNCQLGQTRNGKPFIKCLLADASGRLPGRMWNATEELFSTLPTDGFVRIDGQTQPYQGELQIIIQRIETAKPRAVDLGDLLPHTRQNIDEMFAEVREILATLEHPSLRSLAERYLEDEELMELFKRAPAATQLHHAYIGGLLEHTLSLLRLAGAFCPLYPQLNRDIMLMGLFIHDLGKCAELTWEQGFAYSDVGNLVGHIALGAIWLQRKADDSTALGQPISKPVLNVLQHIVLSHHGVPEFGALKIPSTPEAIAISMLDNLDAKMQMSLSATREGESAKNVELGGHFTEKLWALDTRLYRPDPTTVEE
jgi:3'-5' exoribonuclease